METLHMLGTGNAMVTKCFNTCFAIADDDTYLLDAGGGNGILRQLELSKMLLQMRRYLRQKIL
jgi:ribonuclease Z